MALQTSIETVFLLPLHSDLLSSMSLCHIHEDEALNSMMAGLMAGTCQVDKLSDEAVVKVSHMVLPDPDCCISCNFQQAHVPSDGSHDQEGFLCSAPGHNCWDMGWAAYKVCRSDSHSFDQNSQHGTSYCR